MIKFIALGTLISCLATAVSAQPTNSTSSSSTTYDTPFGQVTHSQSTTPIGNGSYTTQSVSPGNGSSIAPYAGSSTLDQYPNNTPSATGYHVGIIIPIGSGPGSNSGSTSSSASKPSSSTNSSSAAPK